MAKIIEEISRFCRFCLRREGLMALSKATSTAFSIADVVHYTGIEIYENGCDISYAICLECCTIIQNSVCFRRSCFNNDVQFKRLVALLNAVQIKDKVKKNEIRTTDASIVIDIDCEHSANEAQFEEREENDVLTVLNAVQVKDKVNRNENCKIDASIVVDSGDCEHSENEAQFEERDDNDTLTVPLDDNESDDSLSSLYGEVMKGLIEKCSSTKDTVPIVLPIQKSEDRYVCEVCGNQYVDIYNHVKRSHRPQKKFACSRCQKTFNTPFCLKRHVNTWHEKRITYTCEHCGRGFTNHSSYFYHIKNSHGESDGYECEICHRKFKSHDGHRKHQKEHSITCYSCSHCGKLFRTMKTLKLHERRYHGS